jgi:Tfp pilus assembly protein PilO
MCAATLVQSCSHRSATATQLDAAESVMEQQPDSALAILSAIDGTKLSGRKERARYALLMSMALDKNYVDTTTFSILQPAIDFYLQKGSPDERLRTYYYQGRISQNMGDGDNAMMAFIRATELDGATDSLTLARVLVAQGALLYKQYKPAEYIDNNLRAARMFAAAGKRHSEIRCYSRALDASVILQDQHLGDSLKQICTALIESNPDDEIYVTPSILAHTIAYGSENEIRDYMRQFTDDEMIDIMKYKMAFGYATIGDGANALKYLSEIDPGPERADSIRYNALKAYAFERLGDYRAALAAHKAYVGALEELHHELFTHDLLFSEDKYKMEIANLREVQLRDRKIWWSHCGVFALTVLIFVVCYLYYRSYVKKLLMAQENTRLMNEQERLRAEKEKIALGKKAAEVELERRALELENLRLEKAQLEGERANLHNLLQTRKELAAPIQDAIKERLNVLNGLLAKEISENDTYAKPYMKWIDSIRVNRNEFMESTRLAFTASHPAFMDYILQKGLTDDEVKYVCLYAMGLRGKEIGEYIQLKRHYTMSSTIRRKLGIDEHETNIGLYIRRLMEQMG